MTRPTFDKSLRDLQDEVLIMGAMVDKALDRAVDSLKRKDLELAQRVVSDDALVNRKRYDIEEMCLTLIATQQPMARDLRIVSSVMHVIVDLERMGDYAAGIAKINLMMGKEPLLKPLIDLPKMAEKSREMLSQALEAFIDWDVEKAKSVAPQDDEVDDLYDRIYLELITFMIQDPHSINRATHLLWAAHDIERLADRVTNICERTVFMVTGHLEEFNVSTY